MTDLEKEIAKLKVELDAEGKLMREEKRKQRWEWIKKNGLELFTVWCALCVIAFLFLPNDLMAMWMFWVQMTQFSIATFWLLKRIFYPAYEIMPEDEMSAGKILDVRRGLASDEAWSRHQASRQAIEAAWKLFHENIDWLLQQYPGKYVAIQDGQLMIGDSAEELTKKLDMDLPHIIIPIRPFPVETE